MRLYVIAYCQNVYQKERIESFVEDYDGEILNPDFAERDGDLRPIVEEGWKLLMQQSDKVLIFDIFYPIHLEQEERAKELGLDTRYFKMAHSGKYAGRAHEVGRGDLRR